MIEPTSRKAYREIKREGLLSDARMRVYEALCTEGAMTGRELDEYLGSESAHKRLSELESLGVAESVEKRKCSITGRTAKLWRTTEELPSESNSDDSSQPGEEQSKVSRLVSEASEHGMVLVEEDRLEEVVNDTKCTIEFDDRGVAQLREQASLSDFFNWEK